MMTTKEGRSFMRDRQRETESPFCAKLVSFIIAKTGALRKAWKKGAFGSAHSALDTRHRRVNFGLHNKLSWNVLYHLVKKK